MKIDQIRVVPDVKNTGKYKVQKEGILFRKVLKSNLDYQQAIEYAKRLGNDTPASQLKIYKSKNSLTKEWAYKKHTVQNKWNKKVR